MKYRLVAYGKPALAYARDGIAEYQKRLTRYASCDLTYLKDNKCALQASDGCLRIALDERGTNQPTRQWAQKVSEWEKEGNNRIAFLLGGAEGHSDVVRQQADAVWQLGAHTMNHELALLVLLEQLYRIETLRAGHPYHRE